MKHDPSPTDLVDLLRRLPAVEPPADLPRSIMEALPAHRGTPGRLEHGVRKSFAGRPRSLWLPSSPSELGLLILSAGVCFCCLTAVIRLRLPVDGHHDAFLPTLAAGLMLMFHGWRQLKSPRSMLGLRFALAAVCGLFAVNAILGLSYGIHSWPGLIATWLGLSGILVAGGLGLALAAPSIVQRFSPRLRARTSASSAEHFYRE